MVSRHPPETLGKVTTIIAVWGAAPGIGKSTLCTGLADWLAGAGLRVGHFAEEEIFTRPQFADVASHFRSTGDVEAAMLLAATSRFAESLVASGTHVIVADALVPFVPSLLAMGYNEQMVADFVADLTTLLAPVKPVLVFLDGDIAAALARAAAREGPGWLEWYTGKLAHYGLTPNGSDLASAAVTGADAGSSRDSVMNPAASVVSLSFDSTAAEST